MSGSASVAPAAGVPARASRPLAWTFALLALAGAGHAQAFSVDLPGAGAALSLAALALLFGALQDAGSARHPTRRAALCGFAFGLGWFGRGVWWTYISMHGHGGMWAPLAAVSAGLLAALLALFPALACALWQALAGRPDAHAIAPVARRLSRLLAFAACWTLSEWARSRLLGGFPWIATGIAQLDGPLAGWAPLLGEPGVSFLATLCAGSLRLLAGDALDRLAPRDAARGAGQPRVPLAATATCLALVVLLVAGGAGSARVSWSQAEGAALTVRLVQGNVPQDLKFGEDGLAVALDAYGALAVGQGPPPSLVVLPESVFPVPYADLPERGSELLGRLRAQGSSVLLGSFVFEPDGRIFNGAIGIDRAGAVSTYRKSHLVPFGEFVPNGLHWFVALLDMPIGDQVEGERDQPPMTLAGQRIAVNICFEQLFGDERILAWRGPEGQAERGPGLLVNLSNLAWFDDSVALPQFLRISRMRALETARPMLVDTNSGPTAVIGPRGEVLAAIRDNQPGALDGEVTSHRGDTPYVRWGSLPTLATSAALLAALGARALWARSRRDPAALSATARKTVG